MGTGTFLFSKYFILLLSIGFSKLGKVIGWVLRAFRTIVIYRIYLAKMIIPFCIFAVNEIKVTGGESEVWLQGSTV